MNFIRSVFDSVLIQFPKVVDPRGNLTFIEENRHIPFEIRRVYWIYDVPGGEERGGHAFRTQEECVVALSGSFDIILNDGSAQKTVQLNRAYNGLYIPRMLWRSMRNFSTNAVAFVLASTDYDANDYIYDYDEYRKIMRSWK